jgi:CheY-like chemotaxis protein
MAHWVGKRRGPPPDLAGARVLVVEAEDDTLELYILVLRRGGAEVRGVRCTAEALQLLEGWRARVIVTVLDRSDEAETFALAEALRGRDAAARLVAVTADAYPASRARVIASGFRACLPMPVHPTELRWAVADALL